MAHVKPLTNYLNYRNDAKRIQEIEEVSQLPGSSQAPLEPDFDLSAVYKKYED
jgi:hypothetical protein